MRKSIANIICWFIPFKRLRKRVRLGLSLPIRKYVRFVKSFSSSKHPNIKVVYGYRCRNLVVILDDKYVFKFPRGNSNGWEISEREKRITDALRPVSPIKIPQMDIFDYDGVAVRRYEYVAGTGFNSLDDATQVKHTKKIAKQVAKFLYVVGKSDPIAIRDLKPQGAKRPSMMYGWNQNDLWDNFLLNPKTFDVVASIDWEDAIYGSFKRYFTSGTHNKITKDALLREYMKYYAKK